MPTVTINEQQTKQLNENNQSVAFVVQSDADNKFLEVAQDYDSRAGYVKILDDVTKKIYTHLDFTITCENVI